MKKSFIQLVPRRSEMKILFCLVLLVGAVLLVSCEKSDTMFVLQDKDDTGVKFANNIYESDSLNIFTYEYIYNGGGVAVADFNNDGLQDIFFSGNMVPNKLYINRGEWKYEDVSDIAKINSGDKWNSGVTVVDINNDGRQDLYVCATKKQDSLKRANTLYVNKGVDANNVPVFEEMAHKYGVDDTGHSMMASFFDYDRDGDLDLYVLTNKHWNEISSNYIIKIKDGSSPSNDRLYRNNGNGSFTNVTKEAGILIDGYGLGLAISDLNQDGWPDIYVSNDFLTNDIMYINNQDGTFTNRSPELMKHQSMFSMGNDAADFNNDGLTDIITVDMLPETNDRKKTMINNKNYQTYLNNEKYGYEYQYMRNMLQMNNGAGVGFSDIGQMAGVQQTEWSWSPLLADFDNDGLKDLAITNGFPKDITDKDFMAYKVSNSAFMTNMDLIDSVPVVKIPNYIFKNNGDLTFTDVSKQWGFVQPSFSNGAAYADLDNDGDLDYVVNNINDVAFLYRNTFYEHGENADKRFLRIKLVGKGDNRDAIGSNVKVYANGRMQFFENQHERGYLSSVERFIHVGLGKVETIDSVVVTWPDGKAQILTGVKPNQVLTIEYKDNDPSRKILLAHQNGIVTNVASKLKINFKHHEEDKIDFNIQRTLPHKFSQAGPGIAVGDINNDGLEDFVIGGTAERRSVVFTQQKDGTFTQREMLEFNESVEEEGLLLFDADNDNDLDLYVVSGSIEHLPGSKEYLDLLYRNDGKGNFIPDTLALPPLATSGSCVRAADIEGDGDLDLFVGGRVVPGAYPLSPESSLLINNGGRFADGTRTNAPEFLKAGMITDALFSDFDSDGDADLITVGEFVPVTFFKNQNGHYTKFSESGIDKQIGWWSSISGADFDFDGDIDYVVGNLGKNNPFGVTPEFPLKIFAKDFDGNGSVDAILACHIKESIQNKEAKHLYPVHFWDELYSQSPKFRRQFRGYKQYGKATMEKLLKPEELKDALVLEANYFETSYLENKGGGKFALHALPNIVQTGPINGIISSDFNNDDNLDIMAVGNDFGNEVFIGRYDGLNGIVLLGDGKGGFSPVMSKDSRFIVRGDAKGLVKLIDSHENEIYLATQNRDSLKVYTKAVSNDRSSSGTITPSKNDAWADVELQNGKKVKIEFYYGSGFLSQSSRKQPLPRGATQIIIHSFDGKTRKVVTGAQTAGL